MLTTTSHLLASGFGDAPELIALSVVAAVAWLFFGRYPSKPILFEPRKKKASAPRPAASAELAIAARKAAAKTPSPVAVSTPGRECLDASIFDSIRRLDGSVELGELIQGLVRMISEDYGFGRVLVRLYNPRVRIFEAHTLHGFSAEQIGRFSTLDVTLADWSSMTTRAMRMRASFRVSRHDERWSDQLADHRPERTSEKPWTPEEWRDSGFDAPDGGDLLVVPLLDSDGQTIGYLCGLPADQFPDEAAIARIELLTTVAAASLRHARLRAKLQRRELEYSIVSEQLRESQSLRDNFVANISHELRTPLTSVKAYAETLSRGIESMDPQTTREFVGVIEHEADRLNEVFDDLLDVAHLEGRGRRIARDRLDLRELVAETCQAEHERFAQAQIDLRFYGPSDPMWVQGDVDGMRQVIHHLLGNALKFTPAGGRVRVQMSEQAGTVVLEVEDTGIGIPEHDLTRIFDRFYQVDGSATRAYGGQGLGLALCREIVGWHNGRIRAEGNVGGGSRFIVHLPVRGFVVRQSIEDQGLDNNERMQWEAFLKLAIDLVSELAGTRVASIMLVDEANDVLRIEAAIGLDEEIVQNSAIPQGEGVAGRVWAEQKSVLVPDLDADPSFAGLADDITYVPRSLLSVPLCWEGRVVGVLNVNTKLDTTAFDDNDRLLVEALADRIVLALENFERYRSGYRRLASVESGVRAMLDVGRQRQTSTRAVFARIGVETGRRLDLDEDHLRALSYAVRTYDLGLSEVSAQILRKVSPLTVDERQRIEAHVNLGAELIADLEPSPKVRKMILHHHENVDGSGYPDGIRGEAIPVGARILRLVDTMSALLHERPFRSAVPLQKSTNLILESVGTRFCPRVAPVFLSVVEAHAEELQGLVDAPPLRAPCEIELGPSTTAS